MKGSSEHSGWKRSGQNKSIESSEPIILGDQFVKGNPEIGDDFSDLGLGTPSVVAQQGCAGTGLQSQTLCSLPDSYFFTGCLLTNFYQSVVQFSHL